MSVLSVFDGLAVVEHALGLRSGRAEHTGRVEACLPPHVPTPVPGPCKGWRTKIKKIKPRARAKTSVGASLFDIRGPLTPEQKAEVGKIYGGTFGGLTVKPTEATRSKKGNQRNLTIKGRIFPEGVNPNAPGAQDVGEFTRILYEQDGQRWATHDLLVLDEEYQGQGFATKWNAQAMDWYREHDVAGVELRANIDIGGIAWARKGYDFKTKQDAISVEERILNTLNDMASGNRHQDDPDGKDRYARQWWKMPPERMREQVQQAVAMRRRMINTPFGSDDYPTPYEISEVGRWPGAKFTGDDLSDDGDWWIGRVIMTGSDWDGVTLP